MNSLNSLSVNSPKSLPQNEKFVTTKELASILGVNRDTVNYTVERLNNDGLLRQSEIKRNSRGGYLFTEKQATIIKQEIQKHHNLANRQIDSVSTELEENETIFKALSILQQRNDCLKTQLADMKPKAECYDELIDATGLFNLQTTSKMLGVNFNWFKNCLIDNEYLYRGSHDTLLPYANRKNIFVVKEWTKNGIAGFQTLVTPKGTDILRTLFKVWEKEYQKIMNKTAGNYLERAIKNCPECNHTIVDLSESFSIKQVAKIIEEPEETVLNFIAAKGWIDPETKKPLLLLKYIDSNGRITVDGKDKIVSAFFTIKKTEKGMKAFSCGKGE